MNQLQLFLILVVLGLSYALPVTKVEEKKEEHKDETADDVEVIGINMGKTQGFFFQVFRC